MGHSAEGESDRCVKVTVREMLAESGDPPKERDRTFFVIRGLFEFVRAYWRKLLIV